MNIILSFFKHNISEIWYIFSNWCKRGKFPIVLGPVSLEWSIVALSDGPNRVGTIPFLYLMAEAELLSKTFEKTEDSGECLKW
jgi:hypothetical protein